MTKKIRVDCEIYIFDLTQMRAREDMTDESMQNKFEQVSHGCYNYTTTGTCTSTTASVDIGIIFGSNTV